jgi:catechol 2,3-dioxygenase
MNAKLTNDVANGAKPTSIHPATQVGLVALTIPDLDRAINFYTGSLGLQVVERDGGTALLGSGLASAPILHLVERRDALPRNSSNTGLYHFAILVPGRADLGRSLRHLIDVRYLLSGASDHLVSEALYLDDPDGNGIEIYRDRPRQEWPMRGNQVQMATDPLDVEGVLAAGDADPQPWDGVRPTTRLGHVHLQVSDIRRAEAFYRGVLGFDVIAKMPSALFVSAGGYHHHLGLNTWQSRGGSAPPANSVGLRFFTIDLPDEAARTAVVARLDAAGIAHETQDGAIVLQDPDGIGLHLRV